MRFSILAAIAATAALASAVPAASDHVLHEKRSEAPKNWVKRSRMVNGGIKLPMRIGLTQTNLDKGHDLLMEVSVPPSLLDISPVDEFTLT
jgi:tripeptidyl-peptidase-1